MLRRCLHFGALAIALTSAAFAATDTGADMLDPIRVELLRPAELLARLHLRPGDRVADIGAGPGFFTLPLAEKAAEVIATDIRADLLAVANARAQAAHLRNVRVKQVAPTETGLEPRSMDLVFMCQVDHLLATRAAYFRDVAAALRPGGRIAVVNRATFRDPVRRAASVAGLRIVDEWSPSPLMFAMVLTQ